MKHAKLGCCYFPTNVILIDDNDKFLDTIVLGLNSNFKYHTFTEVHRFDRFLEKNHSQLKSIQWAKATDNLSNIEEHDKHEIAINFHAIYKQIYNLKRYDEISVIVVDYAMPECSGIEVCKSIGMHNPHIKLLLLTGEADNEIAVKAFNDKLIDKFVPKENMDTLAQKLNGIIAELAQDYFCQVLEGLNVNLIGCNQLFTKKPYLDLFQSIYDQHQACEYYLIDPSGGYLMLNADGHAKWLVLKNEEDIQAYTDLAQDEEHLSKEVLTQIKQEKLIPFYHGEYLNLPLEHWEKHMLPAHRLSTILGDYLYATDDNWTNSTIDKDLVRWFNLYLR